MKDPDQLIDDYLHHTLDESGQTELRIWLMADTVHMQRFTEAVMFDQEIRAAIHAKEGANSADRFAGSVTSIQQHTPSATPFRSTPKTSHRLARGLHLAWQQSPSRRNASHQHPPHDQNRHNRHHRRHPSCRGWLDLSSPSKQPESRGTG